MSKFIFMLFVPIVFSSIISLISMAEDHGGGHEAAPAAGGHEAAPEAGGHGGGSEAAKPAAGQQADWIDMQNKISILEGRLFQKKDTVSRLIQEKQHLPANSPRARELSKELSKEHSELQKAIEEYEKESTIYRFRYPDRGSNRDKKPVPVEKKTIEQIEQELGLEGRLTRNMQKLRGQYIAPSKNPDELDTKNSTIKPEKEKSIEESGIILLRK